MPHPPARKRLSLASFTFLTCLLLPLFAVLFSLAPRAADAAPADRPKLVVVIVIDQFRADYLERFGPQFGPNGFARILRDAANFTGCYYPYAGTETGPGHSSIATGATPDRHGIAGNAWFDFAKGKVVEGVDDDDFPLVGGTPNAKGVSPRNQFGTTLAGELHLATGGKARVFGVSLKDRASMFSTGQTANGAYWYDRDTGNFVSSRYYGEALPGWLSEYNATRPVDRYLGKDWVVDGKTSVSLTTSDGKPNREFYGRFIATPYASDVTVELARMLFEKENLGNGPVTDFLFLGFSANDYVGHQFGPYSNEVAAITLKTDALIADFLRFLDQRLGAGNYWLALSADHGVAPTLTQSRARRLTAKDIRAQDVTSSVSKALTDRWGEANWLIRAPGIYFDRETLTRMKVSIADAARVAGDAAMQVDGVAAYYSPWASGGAVATVQALRLSYVVGRGPDVDYVQEPFALINRRVGTTHGTPYSYDTHVPCLLVGAPFKPGVYPERASPTDLSPTLAAVLGINPPSVATGRVLAEAIREKPQALPPGKAR